MIFYGFGTLNPENVSAANKCHGSCWNPSGTRRIRLLEVSFFIHDFDLLGETWFLQRITARGTAGSTFTPGANSSEQADSAPPSGFVIDSPPFSVQPTKSAAALYAPGAIGNAMDNGFLLPLPRSLIIKPGSGVGIFFRPSAGFAGVADSTWVVDD